MDLEERKEELEKRARLVRGVSQAVVESRGLSLLLHLILVHGNSINEGTSQPSSAKGLTLASVATLAENGFHKRSPGVSKDAAGGAGGGAVHTTLLDYVIELCEREGAAASEAAHQHMLLQVWRMVLSALINYCLRVAATVVRLSQLLFVL